MPSTGLFPGLTNDDTDQFESDLQTFIDSRELPLYKIMAYHLGWVDQNGEPEASMRQDRSHGHLVLATSKAVGGDNASAMPYAIAAELVYNFMRVHEDVQNANAERNNRPTVWWAWGPAQAINAGDGIHAMARISILEQRKASGPASDPRRISMALETLDNATLEVCEGEYLDISFQERAAVGVEDILTVARKHGALFGASARLGGIAVGADSAVLDALTAYGTAAGTARSLDTDLKALWPAPDSERDEVQRGRLQSKKKSLAIAHAIETGTPTTRRRLGEIFIKRVLDLPDFDVITAILEETGSRTFSDNHVKALTTEAISALESGGFSDEHRATLAEAARLIVDSA